MTQQTFALTQPTNTWVITNPQEVWEMTRSLQGYEGRATRLEQVYLLTDMICTASVIQHSLVQTIADAIPLVRFTYKKVTSCPIRQEGSDYHGAPSARHSVHMGVISKVARNASDGHIYVTLDDANRTISEEEAEKRRAKGRSLAGWTALRLEGICSFEYVDPRVQRRTLARLHQRVPELRRA